MSDEDPALTESLDLMFERNDAAARAARASPCSRAGGSQPHSALKKRCRDALAKWSGAKGVLVPVQNVRVELGGKSFMTGRIGCGDDLYLLDGRAFSLEYKHGHDTQRESQKVFQRRWEAAGGVYLIVRSPEQLVADVKMALAMPR